MSESPGATGEEIPSTRSPRRGARPPRRDRRAGWRRLRPWDDFDDERSSAEQFRRELLRKLIHLATVAIPVLVWVLPRQISLAVLFPVVFVALVVEWARLRVRWVRYHFLRRTRTLLRHHERRNLAGATHMAVAYLLALLLFPRPVAVVAMLYNGLGDAAAALVGRRWGRHRTAWGKSWEGAAAGLGMNLAVGMIVPGVSVPAALLGALAAATLEFLPLPLDDNLRVVLGGGAVAWAATVYLPPF